MPDFPSLRWPQLERVLTRRPLRYKVERQGGSHKKLISGAGYPELRMVFLDNADLAPGVVRSGVTKQVGVPEAEALKVL